MRWIAITLVLCVSYVLCVPPQNEMVTSGNLHSEVVTIKNTMKVLTDQWEKWNTLFLTSLEPRIASTASTLASIDSNIHNLQGRAHVWDTFQLHVSSWNEQLSSLDRKVDIISNAQEKLLTLDNKINVFMSLDYKVDNALKKLNNIEESLKNLETSVQSKQQKNNRNSLVEEFAARGVLTSIKLVERKLDRVLLNSQNNVIKTKNIEPKLTVKCNVPKVVEELLNDISAKVDIMFDHFKQKDDNEYDDYVEPSSDEVHTSISSGKRPTNMLKRGSVLPMEADRLRVNLEQVLQTTGRIEDNTLMLLDKQNAEIENIKSILKDEIKVQFDAVLIRSEKCCAETTRNISALLGHYFDEQKNFTDAALKTFVNKKKSNKFPNIDVTTQIGFIEETVSDSNDDIFGNISDKNPLKDIFDITTRTSVFDSVEDISTVSEDTTALQNKRLKIINDQNKTSCEDLEEGAESGSYVFSNNKKDTLLHFYNQRYCEIRADGFWTVIQRRDNYTSQQNFSLSWEEYKFGFGNIERDFWIGNEFLHRLSSSRQLILRIELQDFEGNEVWAEYDEFRILSEANNYAIIIGGYSGDASDSFSSHNGSYFSTFDRKNDEAPDCCPCSVSFGGGWWFNRCFETNLNGVYHKKPYDNDYFRGIIWEHWLGNYSLKRSVMMVKSKGSMVYGRFYTIPDYEDP